MSIDDEVRALAARQHCLISGAQLEQLGVSRSGIQHRVAKGRLQRLATGLFCLGGVPLDQELRLRAALFECGGTSAIFSRTAAAYWTFPGFRIDPVQVLRLRDGTYPPVRFAQLHTTTRLPDTQLVDRDGIIVTSPARTLFDLAGRIHPGQLERLLDRAWSHGLVDWRILHRTFGELQGRGRPGIVIMRELLDVRPIDYVPPASNLERRFIGLLESDGQPTMDRQGALGNDVRPIGRVDFVDRAQRLIIEIQSDVHHTSISDQRDDARRKADLEAAGWRFHPIREWDLWYRGATVQRDVRLLRRR